MREPGYPYFLALLEWLFGAGLTAPIVANLVLSSCSALLISNLGRSISPLPWAPPLAALLFLLHPGVAVAELRSGVESPSSSCCCVCFWRCAVRCIGTGTPSYACRTCVRSHQLHSQHGAAVPGRSYRLSLGQAAQLAFTVAIVASDRRHDGCRLPGTDPVDRPQL